MKDGSVWRCYGSYMIGVLDEHIGMPVCNPGPQAGQPGSFMAESLSPSSHSAHTLAALTKLVHVRLCRYVIGVLNKQTGVLDQCAI